MTLLNRLFGKRCNHDFIIIKRSNVLQLDDMGYPLRLCIYKCEKCDHYKQLWIDVPVIECDELDTGESVLLKWN